MKRTMNTFLFIACMSIYSCQSSIETESTHNALNQLCLVFNTDGREVYDHDIDLIDSEKGIVIKDLRDNDVNAKILPDGSLSIGGHSCNSEVILKGLADYQKKARIHSNELRIFLWVDKRAPETALNELCGELFNAGIHNVYKVVKGEDNIRAILISCKEKDSYLIGNQYAVFLGDKFDDFKIRDEDPSKRWCPEKDDIKNAVAIIRRYLKSELEKKSIQNSDAEKKIKYILKNIETYRGQIIGYRTKGDKSIFISFIPSEERYDAPGWKENIICTTGGGTQFCQVLVNLEAKKVIWFNINYKL